MEPRRRSQDSELLEEQIRRKNAASLHLEAIFGLVLVPLFWLPDWAVIREWVWLTGPLRAIAALWSAGLIFGYRRHRGWVERHVDLLTISYTFYVGAIIILMCWLHEGYSSQYYAGLSLLVVSMGILFAWPLRTSIGFFAALYGFYLLPIPIIGLQPEPVVAAVNQVFLVSMIIVTMFSQRHRYQLEIRDFYSSLDLQRAKESLEEAFGRLERLDRQKTEFFNNITHELRTPLTMVLSMLESILSGEIGDFDEVQQEMLQPMWRNALQLLKLINDLLELSKLNDRFLRLRLEQTDLVELLETVVQHSRPLAARKEISLELELRRLPSELHVDLDQMERVVVNLLSNALKFTDPGGSVKLTLNSTTEHAQITVTDTGVGIPSDRLEMIFERFSQADGSVTRRYGGTGIGLAFAREIVRLHGGEITVRSEVGRGSHFTVGLPLGDSHFDPSVLDRRSRRGPSNAQARRGEDREPREWTRQLLERDDYRFLDISVATERRVAIRGDDARKATKVLAVEDNVDVLRLISAQLNTDHAVFLAQDGLQGLELARRERPDVVITDFMMPRMDGLSLIKAMKADPNLQDIPIIMLTARGRVEDRLDVRGAGADIYLTKPFSPRELKTAIKQLLERRGRQASTILKANVQNLEIVSAGLAHQIHNPLSYIKTALFVIDEQHRKMRAAIRDGELDPGAREAILKKAEERIQRMQDTAAQGVERLTQVTELVRRYAREGYPTETTPYPIDTAVRDVTSLIASRSAQRYTLDLALDAEGCQVACIPEELQEALRNLVQNALDAIPEDGRVTIRTARHEDRVRVEVTDNGPGIPAADLQRIFAPFYTTKDPGKSLGIGLALSLQVVNAVGGTVSVSSPPGGGASFLVSLPTTDAPRGPTSPAHHEE
jgi:signal transduction histidine kinase